MKSLKFRTIWPSSLLVGALVLLWVAALLGACGGDSGLGIQGEQLCDPDDTCGDGLSCVDGVCIADHLVSSDAGIPQFKPDPDLGPAASFPDARKGTPDAAEQGTPDAAEQGTPDAAEQGTPDAADQGTPDAAVVDPPPEADAGPTCVKACDADDPPRCKGSLLQECGNHDADACLEWSTGTVSVSCVHYGEPTAWGACSKACGGGIQGATRSCLDSGEKKVSDCGLCGGKCELQRECNVHECFIEWSKQPQAQKAALGAKATFSAEAQGSPKPAYQWFRDGVAIDGATQNTLKLTGSVSAYRNKYSVKAHNSAGQLLSAFRLNPVLQRYGVTDGDCGGGHGGAQWRCARQQNDGSTQPTINKLCRDKTGLSKSVAAAYTSNGGNVSLASAWNGSSWWYDGKCKSCWGVFTSVTCYR